ncbi:peptidoglycan DD-metalloendopeptidase family protein [Brevibacillus agri]|uniref:peptidoglycan DD-metalloendopeptidase family protein n=1 Tax=Brevibacillus agri TaxID=51101 RepID=UPI001EE5BCF5|nr:peptidoglycan DD-metalloendopeptidase family protein [Brevibacillus agri]MCG5254740.1 peptidoglycan DD-metalloendopeptidase family protein [Brevibacillus agri]
MFSTKWTALLKETSKKTFSNLKMNKRIALFSIFGILLTTSGAAYANHYYNANLVTVYRVFLNGKEIGVVNSPSVVQQWLDNKLKEAEKKNDVRSLQLSDRISFTEEKVFKGRYDNGATLESLSKEAEIEVEAVKVVVNGATVGYAVSKHDIEAALMDLKQKYGGDTKKAVSAASIDDGQSLVKQVKFKESITMEKSSVPASEVLSSEKLQELLSRGSSKQMIYTVQEGDCLGCIAKKYGVKISEILANNPGLTEDTLLQPGQQLNVTTLNPLVTVEVTEEVVKDEVLHYQELTRTNKTLPKGELRVIQPGKEGKKRVTYQIVKENGRIVDKKIINEQILSNPVPRIVERGTKVITSRGTGNMMWPAKGVLTSRFGPRWGRLHKGLDIAGSGSIKATDNGRVILAGWYGDYGNAVIIDHGNGIQTLYGHMRSIKVREGQTVQKGTTIGIMGSTGDSTGVHVHFEVKKGGRIQNPMNYLSK